MIFGLCMQEGEFVLSNPDSLSMQSLYWFVGNRQEFILQRQNICNEWLFPNLHAWIPKTLSHKHPQQALIFHYFLQDQNLC